MPLVTIQATRLSSDQKKRIGDRIIEAFHGEGVHASSVVVLFKPGEMDILLEGLLFEMAQEPEITQTQSREMPSTPAPSDYPPAYKTRPRRTRAELADLKTELVRKLQLEGVLSSFEAQEELGLRDCDWAPATLRRFFSELEAEGAITKQGQKRGTRYVWKGITSQAPVPMAAKLVKKSDDPDNPEEYA